MKYEVVTRQTQNENRKSEKKRHKVKPIKRHQKVQLTRKEDVTK